jgi:hypothetical protein
MHHQLADFLDELNEHIERELTKVPAPVAEALLDAQSGLSTADLLRILAKPERVDEARSRGRDLAGSIPHAAETRDGPEALAAELAQSPLNTSTNA